MDYNALYDACIILLSTGSNCDKNQTKLSLLVRTVLTLSLSGPSITDTHYYMYYMFCQNGEIKILRINAN